MEFSLKDGFLLGVSSAADQIEGGEVNSNWNDWYHKGKIKDGSDPSVADDHWNRWKEDLDLQKEIGVKISRIGIEWPRLEPEKGVFDKKVLKRYKEEIKYLKSLGIRPLLTIHHFGNPMWFEELGGFTKKENLRYFLEYGEYIADEFCDLVSDYITINEPNVYAMNGYFGGDWPPGENSFFKYSKVLSNMAYCHIYLYEYIHKIRKEKNKKETYVSFANHLRVFEPKDKNNLFHRFCTFFVKLCFQDSITKAMLTGDFHFPLFNSFHIKKGEYADFIGINYYSRSMISGLSDGVNDNCPKNDLGWEIYKEGIEKVSGYCYEILHRPIWITENGTCDNKDKFRAKYIAEHLFVMSKSSLPFERYYHWCFCDNFEWMEGESARFGIVHVDYKTQKRTIKESGLFYKELIANNGVTKDMYNKYIKKEKYKVG